jgi:polysaccharide pyruvyl transferase WcaK-like protein
LFSEAVLSTFKSVGILGHYITNNFGDVLLRDLMIDFVRENNISKKILFVNKSDYENKTVIGKFIYFITFAFKCDFLIFAGGGYLESGSLGYNNNKFLTLLFLSAFFTKILRKKYIITAVGAGPNVSGFGGYLIKYICNNSSMLVVRDEVSKECLITLGIYADKIRVLSDAALSVNKHVGKIDVPVIKSAPKVALHLMLRNNELLQSKAELIKIIDVLSKKYDLWIISDNGPLGLEKDLYNCFPEKKYSIKEIESNYDFLKFISDCDFVITTKLHVGIVAYSYKVPVFNIYRHEKCKNFYSQIGKKDSCVSLEHIDSDLILKLVDSGIGDNDYYESSIYSQICNKSEDVYLSVKEFIDKEFQ